MKLGQLPKSLLRNRELKRIHFDQLHDAAAPQVPVIVSFTSIPSRLPIVHLTVRSLLSGTRKPEKVVLWLNDQLQDNIPQSLEELLGPRFEIRYVAGTSSHRKLVHSLQAFPDKIIVTCDDDMMYESSWLEFLYDDHLRYPEDIIANECRAIAYDVYGELLPYRYWYREPQQGITYDALLPIGFGGVLYPPSTLYKDVCNSELYLAITPKADDLWFKAMSYLQGTRSRRASRPIGKPLTIVNSQRVALRSTNVKHDGNRPQWGAVAKHYALKPFSPFAIQQNATKAEKCVSDLQPVDAVITWVDGADPVHTEKLNRHLEEIGERPRSALPTRFSDAGELTYCVMGLLKYAPWLRRIHIVTDAQTPTLMNWLATTPFADKVRIVDHREIFSGYEHYLPTFNTRSISAMLWRIEGLAEQYIYLNDDFVVVRPLQPEDFFRDGKVVLRGHWHSTLWGRLREWFAERSAPAQGRKNLRAKYLISQKVAARIAGFTGRYFQVEHNPHPFLRTHMEAFSKRESDLFNRQISFKLRSLDQYTAESLSAHLELAEGNAIIDNRLQTLQVKPVSQNRWRIKRKLKRAAKQKTTAFVCVQSMDKATNRVRDMVYAWLLYRIGTLDAPGKEN